MFVYMRKHNIRKSSWQRKEELYFKREVTDSGTTLVKMETESIMTIYQWNNGVHQAHKQ